MLGGSEGLKSWLRIGFLQKLIQKKQWQADHVVGYEKSFSLDENAAEELGAVMVDVKKKKNKKKSSRYYPA